MSAMQFVPRRSEERGAADHGWLKSFHSFSFANYQDPAHMHFGSLRVINEDYVAPSKGFGEHSHREFEIFSYVIDGVLEHKDSMGNIERITRGDLQLTSAGTGISHSESAPAASSKTPTHFLQIWAVPHTKGLKPAYYTRRVSDEEKTGVWAAIVKPVNSHLSKTTSNPEETVSFDREGSGPAPVQSHLSMYATLLDQRARLSRPLEGKKAYLHVVQGGGPVFGKAPGASEAARLKVWSSPREGARGFFGSEEVELGEGDGCYIWVGDRGNILNIENVGTGGKTAEVVLFDME